MVAAGGTKPGESGEYATCGLKCARWVWKGAGCDVGGRQGQVQVLQVRADGNWWQQVAPDQVF